MSNEHHAAKLITVVIMSVSLTFAMVTGGFAINLSARVKENEMAARKIDVVLEKISNIEEDISEIKADIKEHRK